MARPTPPRRAPERRRAPRPLWTCVRCGHQFLVPHSYHSCGRYPLDALFRAATPDVRQLFDRFAALVRAAGHARLIPQKTRLVFMSRMRFINVQVRRTHLLVGFVLRRPPARHARFVKVETFSPRSHVAYLRLAAPADLDAHLRRLIAAAHRAGRGV